MARRLVDKVFLVHCTCDRCDRAHARESNGDISPPPGWSFLHVSIYGNQREGALLCATCLALVLAAAAPAVLETPEG
jgi:hypothetical protein